MHQTHIATDVCRCENDVCHEDRANLRKEKEQYNGVVEICREEMKRRNNVLQTL